MKAFIKTILAWTGDEKSVSEGALGVVKAYYGCVEAQGRGTLHCHMLVWVEGGLNPDEIKRRLSGGTDSDFRDRLIAFLDDSISNYVPECDEHAPPVASDPPVALQARRRDTSNLVEKCQRHTHTATCFKYCKPGEVPVCRFELDESNTRASTSFNVESGELELRCIDGMINNFNETVLRACRCNMDIKFIGSGASAKAVLYYITDYITKSDLTSHVTFAALEQAVIRSNERVDDSSEPESAEVRGKHLLQSCAYRMMAQQELSSQQIASHLMDYGDHYTSHEYSNLFWRSFENIVDKQDPSSECQPLSKRKYQILDADDAEDDSEVCISVDSNGNLVARASRVSDYINRGRYLKDMSLWEYTARVQK
ncbi:hypothetical protein BDZ89DRAFT_897504, partial [Hymenopellis radicata]